jgi:single-stranded-DNA-specific exonuclease
MEIKNLKKAAERILKAIKEKEEIVLYGDADLDGVTSVIILKETIEKLGYFGLSIYFPDREKEGYGISEIGLNFLRPLLKNGRPLLIGLDFGITNFKEIKQARKLGFEVMVIDHHQPLDQLPEAKIIVNPKQEGDRYPFKDLATVGIIFKLSQILLPEKIFEELKRNFLELVAIATIADMMPREKENKIFIEEGKKTLENSQRLGIRIFFAPLSKSDLEERLSKFISILNIREVKNQLPASYRLLTASSFKEAKEIIEKLLAKNKLRRAKINQMLKMVEKEIQLREPIIFFGGPNFEFSLISLVASTICQKYKKPTFIYKKLQNEAMGTVRTPSGLNSVFLMKKCSKELLGFGGHPSAAGFRIKNENLKKFKNCLLRNYEKSMKVRKIPKS